MLPQLMPNHFVLLAALTGMDQSVDAGRWPTIPVPLP
jgi:hypothetical protein